LKVLYKNKCVKITLNLTLILHLTINLILILLKPDLIIKDNVHSCAHVRTLFTFCLRIFVKYDILTEYLTIFWFAMLVNEYKLYSTFQFKKVRKMQNLGNVYVWGSPFVMSRTDAQNGVDIIFN
jgi:hypothetical protein